MCSGPTLMKSELYNKPSVTSLFSGPIEDFHVEYGNLTLSVEVVASVEEAIRHINTYSR